MIKITIPIPPKAQKRDRIATFGGHARSYKDKAQKLEENKILSLLMDSRPPVPFSGAVYLWIRAFLPIPTSKPHKWKLMASQGNFKPTTKPDIDNLAKNIMDVMSGVYFLDDKQITSLMVTKLYSNQPRWEIWIQEEVA